MSNPDESESGVKIYDRPETPPSRQRALSLVIGLILFILLAALAYYAIVIM